MYLDLHTHHPQPAPAGDLLQVVSQRPQEALPTGTIPTLYYRSVGLHPWYAEDLTPTGMLALEEALRSPDVLALGEMGLDKLCTTPLSVQEEYFCQQIELAEERRLPVILHVVRAWDELIRLRKALRPQTPWIIHGFRGRGEQARQLLRLGFYLSFGDRADSQALRLALDARRLFLETDDHPAPDIRAVYARTAEATGQDIPSLCEQINDVTTSLFPILSVPLHKSLTNLT